MNINEAKENLRKYLPLLPETAQVAAEFLLKKFDETVRELEELKRNTAVQSKVKNLLHELWRDVIGYEGFYQVSNFGRVKSFYRIGERLLTQQKRLPIRGLDRQKQNSEKLQSPHSRCASVHSESRKQTRCSPP